MIALLIALLSAGVGALIIIGIALIYHTITLNERINVVHKRINDIIKYNNLNKSDIWPEY